MSKVQDKTTALTPFFERLSRVLPDHDAACAYFYATPTSKLIQKAVLTAEIVGLAAYVPVVGPVAAFALAAWSVLFFQGPVRGLKDSTYLPVNWSLPTVQARMMDHFLREHLDSKAKARAAAHDPKLGRFSSR